MRTRSMTRPAVTLRGVGLLAGLALLLSACSGGLLSGYGDEPETQPAAQPQPTEPTPTTLEDAGAGYGQADPDSGAGDGYGQAGDEAGEGGLGSGEGGSGYGEDGAQPAPAGEVGLTVAETGLGPVLADTQGRTLYAFTNDQDGTSTCYEDCEANWPALLAAGSHISIDGGMDRDLVGVTHRQDGSTQLTYAGWPLYTYAGDQAPGDVNGQAVGDVWWVLDAAGQLVTQ